MVWSEEIQTDNYLTKAAATSKGKQSVRALRTRKVNRYRPGLDGVTDNFIFTIGKTIAKGVTKVITKDKEKEAQRLAAIDAKYDNPVIKGANKLATVVAGTVLGIAGVKGLSNKLKKESEPQSVAKIDTSGFTPNLVKPAINLPGTANSGSTSTGSPSPFQSVDLVSPQQRPVGEAPVSNGIVNKILDVVDFLPEETKRNIEQRGNELIAQGKGKLTEAQERLLNSATNAALLPKTKRLKEAERLLTTPQNEEPTKIAGINSGIVWGVVILLVIGAVVYFASK